MGSIWISLWFSGIVLVRGQVRYTALQNVPPGCDQLGPDARNCYTLYIRADRGGSTWDEALNYCRSIGSQLAIVPDNNTRSILGGFESSQQTGNGHLWIAARRDTDVTGAWKTVKGSLFQYGVNTEFDRGTYCAVLTPNGQLLARACYYTARPALCQRTISFSACQTRRGYYIDGICLTLSSRKIYSWYEAREYCRSDTQNDGELGYLYITSAAAISSLGITVEVWVGVMKEPWAWYYGDGRRIPVAYQAWRAFEGAGKDEDCAHAELNDKMRWSDKSCSQQSKGFICETVRGGVVQTQSTTASTAATTTASTAATTTASTAATTTASTATIIASTTTTTTAIPTTTPSTTTTTLPRPPAADDKTRFSYDDIFNGSYWPMGYHGYFLDGNNLTYRDLRGHINIEDVATGVKKLIMPYAVLASLNAWTYYISPDNRFILIGYDRKQLYRYSFTARYKIYDIDTEKLVDFPKKTSIMNERLQIASWSKTGHRVSFVYENNLYYQLDPNTEAFQVTNDGNVHYIFNGVPDWMFEEDILWSRFAHYWSSNSTYICYAKFNLTGIPLTKLPVYGSANEVYPDSMEFVYPKAGDIKDGHAGLTTRVELFIINTRNPNYRTYKISPPPEFSEIDHYYTQVSWRDDSTVYIEWINRATNIAVTSLCDVTSVARGCIKNHVLTEENAWVHIPAVTPVFMSNAQHYLTILPKTVVGYGRMRHVAKVKIQNSGTTIPNRGTGSVTFLTDGNQEVTEIVGYDNKRQIVYFISTNGVPTDRHLFSVGTWTGAARAHCMTCGIDPGCLYVDASFSATGQYYMQMCRGPAIPTYYLKSTVGSATRALETNAEVSKKLSQKLLPRKEMIDIDIGGGVMGKAEILFPPNFNPRKQYRYLHYVYGAPDSQQVLNDHILGSYRTNWLLYLSSFHDVIITTFDGRGSYGYGDKMRHDVYKKLGVMNVEDQITAVRYFMSRPYINSTNAAVIGWSYGGKMSSLLLTDDSNLFRCGVAISADTNMRYYNRAYTERYLGFANDSSEVYDLSDVTRRALKFRGKKFFIAHGTKDDNIHLVHFLQLVHALTDVGVQFTQYLYTDENHNLAQYRTTRHLYKAMADFLMTDCWG